MLAQCAVRLGLLVLSTVGEKVQSCDMCTGFHRKYIKYTVTTKTDLKAFAYSPVQVVRRFSDFVELEQLLRVRSCPYILSHVASLHGSLLSCMSASSSMLPGRYSSL